MDTLSTIFVHPSSWPRCDRTKNMDSWCDAISSSPSLWTSLSALSFLHSFLEDVLEVFCEHKAPIVFSPGADIDGVYTTVLPYSWPRCYMYLWCNVIESSPSSWTGLSAPSFSHSSLEDVLDVFCEQESPIIFSPGDASDGLSTIVCPSYWSRYDMDFWCDTIASSTSS